MQMLTVASKLDMGGWIRGVVGAFISGGAGSLASGFGATMADPSHDINVFKVMWITFLFSGVISLAKFLQTQPVPEPPKS